MPRTNLKTIGVIKVTSEPYTTSSLLEAVPLPLIVIGVDERIVALNDGAAKLFGRHGTGRHYITALRQPEILDCVEAILTGDRERKGRYLGAEGSSDTVWQVTARAMVADGARQVALTFEDITAAEAAGQMRRNFVANVSHELRTPLTALVGFIETLRGPAKDDAAARDRFLGIMEAETGRMSRLVEDLLSLSRVEEDERVRPLAPVDLTAIVKSTADLLSPMAAEAGVDLRVTLPDGSGGVVPGDERQLQQVLRNLVENAIKYGASGGVVEVSLSATQPEPSLRGDGMRLTVRDEGEGIAAHHIARLTERFYRVDSHRSREVGGTGLGLAIVKHIVNRHRGRLRIESRPETGTTFTVILPLT